MQQASPGLSEAKSGASSRINPRISRCSIQATCYLSARSLACRSARAGDLLNPAQPGASEILRRAE